MRTKILAIIFVLVFFFALPFEAYRTASFLTDQYFRIKGIPYPSEYFALLAGISASCWMVGLSFFLYGFLYQKRRNAK